MLAGNRHSTTFLCSAILTCCAVAQGQSVVINGVEYREISELNKPRIATAQPQLGAGVRVAQYNPANTVWPNRVPSAAPADQRPVLNSVGQPISQSVAAYSQPYAYGYGYANGCSWRNCSGYGNRLPPPNAFPTSQMQPVGNQQPYGGVMPLAFTNLQPAAAATFNPYGPPQTKTPWRPLVPIRNMPVNYEIGQGLIGQPKLYVPDQPIRNFIRYITP
jgi:hypothetical protein